MKYVTFAAGVLLSRALVIVAQTTTTSSNLTISLDARCGASFEATCLGSTFGNCCSEKGYCGADESYCNAGCQPGYGLCNTGTNFVSTNGNCGTSDPDHQVCLGSTFGDCCSEKGYCGGTSDYCGVGCQTAFGTCSSTNTSSGTTTSSAASSSTLAVTNSQSSSAASSGAGSSASTPNGSASSSAGALNNTTEQEVSVTDSIGFKAGMGVLGGVLGLALIGGLVFFLLRRKRTKAAEDEAPMTESKDRSQNATVDSLPEFGAGPDAGYTSDKKTAFSTHELGESNTNRYELSSVQDHKNPVELPSKNY